MSNSNKGFTLIELLVVISIIGVLSGVVLSSLQSARAKARDTRRIQDLNQIRTALFLYYDTYGNWVQSGSGCGYQGNGDGWFSHTNSNPSSYPASISQCLVNAGSLPTNITDPSGATFGSTPSNNIYAYIKYSCAAGTWLYAKLEPVPQSSTATDGTC